MIFTGEHYEKLRSLVVLLPTVLTEFSIQLRLETCNTPLGQRRRSTEQ